MSLLSRAEYQVLVEQSPVMIWRADTSTECDFFNERWLQFTGRSMAQEIGNQWATGVHPEDLQRCLESYLNAFAKRDVFEMHYRLRRHDGAYRWILDRGGPFFGEDGEFAGYIGSCIDVTEQLEARRSADEARERELASLRGLLRICASCKRIRNNDGTWDQIEAFIASHSEADFTHGMCQDCLNAQLA